MQRKFTMALVAAMATLGFGPTRIFDGASEAAAAVSIGYTLDQLVEQTPSVVVAQASERQSVWEKVGGSKRIVTYTRLEVESPIYGAPGKVVWVRTLGGAVGKIGQHVAGEARFDLGSQALVFLTATRDGITVVSGAAQGHFPVAQPTKKDKLRRVRPSPYRGKILRPRRAAKEQPDVAKDRRAAKDRPVAKEQPDAAARATKKALVSVDALLNGMALEEAIETIRAAKVKRDALRKNKR